MYVCLADLATNRLAFCSVARTRWLLLKVDGSSELDQLVFSPRPDVARNQFDWLEQLSPSDRSADISGLA